MNVFTYESTVEKVAEALYDEALSRSGNRFAEPLWHRVDQHHRDNYLAYARAAVKTYHFDLVSVPTTDMADAFVRVAGRADRAEREQAEVREALVQLIGEPLDPDETTLKGIEIVQGIIGGWKALADIYADERDKARGELSERRDELPGGLYDHLMAHAKALQNNRRTGRELGLPNEIARDDGYSYGQIDAGEALERLLTPRPRTFSVELERTKAELEKVGLALADTSRALGKADAELARRQRQGQAALNVLNIVRPDLYAAVTATENDPFHDDTRLPQFFTWLADAVLAEKAQARMDNDNGVRHELSDVTKECGLDV